MPGHQIIRCISNIWFRYIFSFVFESVKEIFQNYMSLHHMHGTPPMCNKLLKDAPTHNAWDILCQLPYLLSCVRVNIWLLGCNIHPHSVVSKLSWYYLLIDFLIFSALCLWSRHEICFHYLSLGFHPARPGPAFLFAQRSVCWRGEISQRA